MLSSVARTASVVRRRGLRVAILAVVLGLLAPLVSIAGSAQAETLKARTGTESVIATTILNLINSQRRVHHLKPVHMDRRLLLTARRHNAAMSAANTMSHQVRGESALSRRVSAVGYPWSSVGENIAWNSQMTSAGVATLQKLMYNEKAPNDGHRRNILNKSFNNVGVDVYLDAKHHKVWLTTDFGRQR